MSKPLIDISVAIVGYGRVGRVLARAFAARGYTVAGVVSRSTSGVVQLKRNVVPVCETFNALPNEVGFLVLCVPETALSEVARKIAAWKQHPKGLVVAHTAGALSAEAIAPVRRIGASALAWHPLQTFTGDEDPDWLSGVTFGIDGDPEAVETGWNIALGLGGKPVRVPPGLRREYHLAAVFASNLVAALFGQSVLLMTQTGLDDARAQDALASLLTHTAANITRKGLADSITGPVRRGDIETIKSHIETLKSRPELSELYRLLSLCLVDRLGPRDIDDELRRILKAGRKPS